MPVPFDPTSPDVAGLAPTWTSGRRVMHAVRGGSAFVVIDAENVHGSGVRRGDHVHDEFVRKLDAKLKKLQQHHRQQAAAPGAAVRRPIFITTVKTGVFLDPPPDLAALLGLDDGSSSANNGYASKRSYYSYSSKPRVLYDKQHQRCAPCKNEPDE